MRRCRLNVRQLAGAHRTLRVSRPVCGIAAYSKLRERSQHSSWSDLGWSRCFQSSDSVTDWSLHTPRVAARGSARAGPPASPGLTNHKCWLVGAGPGSMDLMTVKAVRLLQSADCVVYDALAPEEALDECRDVAELVFVGKRGGEPSLKQAEIDELLARKCQQHQQVVRLKGGCSTLFARLASELRALVAAGVPYEVVPGVTSPSAAAAAAGIPLTDAVSAQSMLVATAHAADALPWPAFGPDAIGTLVLLMAGRSLGTVVDGCIEAGWPTETAVAIVKSAGQPEQSMWRTTLASVMHATKGQKLSPSVIIVGPVASEAGARAPV